MVNQQHLVLEGVKGQVRLKNDNIMMIKLMTEIVNSSSTPEYIDSFLKQNMVKLVEIHDKGIEENNYGCLGFKCSKEENKMDVFFMNEELILTMISNESWDDLKNNIGGRKLFFIQDLDEKRIFLVYI